MKISVSRPPLREVIVYTNDPSSYYQIYCTGLRNMKISASRPPLREVIVYTKNPSSY